MSHGQLCRPLVGMDPKVGPVALITGLVILTLILIAPRMAGPGEIPLRPTSFFSIILMLIFIPIGLVGLVYVNVIASDPLNQLFKHNRDSLVTLIFLIMFVFLLVALVCMAVHPTDGFLDAGIMTKTDNGSGSSSGSRSGSGSGSGPDKKRVYGPGLDDQIAYLASLEARACALMVHTDKFIEGDVGSKGMKENADGETEDTPEHKAYVKEAIIQARATVPGGVINCENPAAVDLGKRVNALLNTLKFLIGPILVSKYNSTVNSKIACTKTPVPCHSFMTFAMDRDPLPDSRFDVKTLQWIEQKNPTLADVDMAITCYETNILAPLDTLSERLKKGEMTDCERKKASSK